MLKKFHYLFILGLLPFISGCSIVGDIFKAGMWWAFFLVFIVIAVIVWIVSRAKK